MKKFLTTMCVGLIANLFMVIPTQADNVVPLNAERDRDTFDPLDDVGGPDAFGYRFVDNLNGDTATYNWIELRGEPGVTWIEDWSQYDNGCSNSSHPIGFAFPFYGNSYSSFWVTTNGEIQFGASCAVGNGNSNGPLQASGPAVWPYGYNLHLQNGGDPTGNSVVGYKNFGSYTVIEFDSVGFASCGEGSTAKFQAILFNNGWIKFQYNHSELTGTCRYGVVLIQNGVSTFLRYRLQTNPITTRPLSEGRAIWYYTQLVVNGRCCYGSLGAPSCADITLDECLALDGAWDQSLTCAGDPCPSGGGEDCGTATPLIPGVVYTGNTGLNNNDFDYSIQSVGSPDVVFSYSPATDELLTLSLCGSGFATFLHYYVDDCIGAPVTWSAGDFCGIEEPNQAKLYCHPFLAGHTYYIVVDGSGLASGGYRFEASVCPPCPRPLNDDCVNAGGPYFPPATITGNSTCATQDCHLLTLHEGYDAQGETWEAITLTEERNLTIDYCGTPTVWPHVLPLLASGCPCESIGQEADSMLQDCPDGNWRLVWLGVPAGTYYYPVILRDSLNSGGEYTLHVSTSAPTVGRCCYGHPVQCDVTTNAVCETLGGIWSEGADCAVPCEEPGYCADGSLFSQNPPSPAPFQLNILTSDLSPATWEYDNFSGVTEPIAGIRVWGSRALFPFTFPGTDCSEDPMEFVVKFYNGVNQPDTLNPVCTYTVSAVGVPVNVTYPDHPLATQSWDIVFPTPCELTSGWVSVVGAGDPNCAFYWYNSLEGDNYSWQHLTHDTGIYYGSYPYDCAFCFTSANCDPASQVTIKLDEEAVDQVSIRFHVPAAGNYKVYRTIVADNDGDPDNGADPDWTLLTTVAAVAGFNTVTDAPLDAYVNYVIVHDCTPAP